MKTRKRLVSVIVTSCVALCLCLALLAGSTYAWFTDTLVSSGNIIQAGRISISAEVYEPETTAESGLAVKDSSGEDFGVYPIISRTALRGSGAQNEGYADAANAPETDGYYAYGTAENYSFLLENGDGEDLGADLNQSGALMGSENGVFLEPGVTPPFARLIKITNAGSLDAAVKFNFTAKGSLLDDMWAEVLPVTVTSGSPSDYLELEENAAFNPESMGAMDASETAETVLEVGGSEYLLLLFGIYADASNGSAGQECELTMTILATQSVGHDEGDDYEGIVADFADYTPGVYDLSWYSEGETEFHIWTPNQLAGLAHIVNTDVAEEASPITADWDVYLESDMDLGYKAWTPIGLVEADGKDLTCDHYYTFDGFFHGQGHTIYNLNVSTEDTTQHSYVGTGLFGYVSGGVIEDVNIHNVEAYAAECVGALVGRVFDNNPHTDAETHDGSETEQQTVIKDCHVTGLIEISGHHQVGGLVGQAKDLDVENCSVEGVTGSYVESTYAVPDGDKAGDYYKNGEDWDGDSCGGLIGYIFNNTGYNSSSLKGDGTKFNKITDCTVSGLDISGCRKVGGLIGHTSSSNDYSDCTVENTNITLVYNENYEECMEDGVKDKLFVGAIVGEFEWEQKISADCFVTDVTVGYLAEYGIKANQSVDNEPAVEWGLFGGSRNQSDESGNATHNAKVTYEESYSVVTTNFVVLKVGRNGLPV